MVEYRPAGYWEITGGKSLGRGGAQCSEFTSQTPPGSCKGPGKLYYGSVEWKEVTVVKYTQNLSYNKGLLFCGKNLCQGLT